MAETVQHSTMSGVDAHGLQRWDVADLAARDTIVPAATDVHKVAYVQSEEMYYILVSANPIKWKQLAHSTANPFVSASLAGYTLTLTAEDGTETIINLPEPPAQANSVIDVAYDPGTNALVFTYLDATTEAMPLTDQYAGNAIEDVSQDAGTGDLTFTYRDASTKVVSAGGGGGPAPKAGDIKLVHQSTEDDPDWRGLKPGINVLNPFDYSPMVMQPPGLMQDRYSGTRLRPTTTKLAGDAQANTTGFDEPFSYEDCVLVPATGDPMMMLPYQQAPAVLANLNTGATVTVTGAAAGSAYGGGAGFQSTLYAVWGSETIYEVDATGVATAMANDGNITYPNGSGRNGSIYIWGASANYLLVEMADFVNSSRRLAALDPSTWTFVSEYSGILTKFDTIGDKIYFPAFDGLRELDAANGMASVELLTWPSDSADFHTLATTEAGDLFLLEDTNLGYGVTTLYHYTISASVATLQGSVVLSDYYPGLNGRKMEVVDDLLLVYAQDYGIIPIHIASMTPRTSAQLSLANRDLATGRLAAHPTDATKAFIAYAEDIPTAAEWPDSTETATDTVRVDEITLWPGSSDLIIPLDPPPQGMQYRIYWPL